MAVESLGTFGTTLTLFDGFAVDRTTFRSLEADSRWLCYAAGWVNPNDANTATVSLQYDKDDHTNVQLGSITQAGAGWVKRSMGPFDLFATAGVPVENIVIVRLGAQKDLGVDGALVAWNIWLRKLPFQG